MVFQASFVHIAYAKLGQADTGDNGAKLMTKLAPEWVRTSDPVIRSPARYQWTTAPAGNDIEAEISVNVFLFFLPSNKFPNYNFRQISRIPMKVLSVLRHIFGRSPVVIGPSGGAPPQKKTFNFMLPLHAKMPGTFVLKKLLKKKIIHFNAPTPIILLLLLSFGFWVIRQERLNESF